MPRIKHFKGLCNQMNFLQELDLLKIDNACKKPTRFLFISTLIRMHILNHY